MTLAKRSVRLIAAISLVFSSSGVSRADLVTNGSFEQTTNGNGQIGVTTAVTGWSVTSAVGYNFLFGAGTADTTGANGLYLWGPGAGGGSVNNGLPASSPDGGNFVALGDDPNLALSPLQQTISGLTSGDQYKLNFYWAGAQQAGAYGPTTDQIQVSFGSETLSTAVVDNASQGFTGWMSESFTFTADGPSDVLSFLAVGTPAGLPPFALLDGVSLSPVSAVPEPTSLLLLSVGLIGLGAVRRRRGKMLAAA